MTSCHLSLPNYAECLSGYFELGSPFQLTFGQTLENAFVSYSVYGDLSKPTIVVLGGISADQYVADTYIEGLLVKGWWDPLVGYDKAIDLNQFSVLSIDYLDGQSGNLICSNSQPIKISTFDQAAVIEQLITDLKIDRLDAIIGSSYGGMVALAFAEKYPTKVSQIIGVCCNQQSDARNTALRNLQREILQFAISHGDSRQGLILARSLAMLGYRGASELQHRFPNQIDSESKVFEFPVVSYLRSQGEKFADRFCSFRFINLSLSVDLHRIEATKIRTSCLLIAIEGDLIAPPEHIKHLCQTIGKNAQFSQISSDVGHDGFLKEFEQISQLIKSRIGTKDVQL